MSMQQQTKNHLECLQKNQLNTTGRQMICEIDIHRLLVLSQRLLANNHYHFIADHCTKQGCHSEPNSVQSGQKTQFLCCLDEKTILIKGGTFFLITKFWSKSLGIGSNMSISKCFEHNSKKNPFLPLSYCVWAKWSAPMQTELKKNVLQIYVFFCL